MSRVLFSVWFTIQGIIQNMTCSVWFRIQRIIKMSMVLFSFWFNIQGIIQNTTCSVWFRIQRIIKKCPGYYSASGSVFRVLFKIQPAASGSEFSALFKNVQGIIQRLVQYSAYSKYDLQHLVQDSAYYYKMSWVFFSVWCSKQRIIRGIIQNTTSVLFGVWSRIQGIIIKCLGYCSASGSIFSVLFRELFKIRPAYYSAPGSGLRVLLKKYSRVLFSVWIIKNWLGYYSVSDSVFSMLTCLRFQRTQLKLMFMLHFLFYLAIAINS